MASRYVMRRVVTVHLTLTATSGVDGAWSAEVGWRWDPHALEWPAWLTSRYRGVGRTRGQAIASAVKAAQAAFHTRPPSSIAYVMHA